MTTWIAAFTASSVSAPIATVLPSFIPDNALVTSVVDMTAGIDITSAFADRTVKQGASVWLLQLATTIANPGDKFLACLQSS